VLQLIVQLAIIKPLKNAYKMPINRRQFLTLMGGSAAGAVLFQACGVPEDELIVQSPIEMPEDMVTGLDNWYATLCRMCQTSEGIVVRVMEGRAKKIEGNVDYPLNQGKHSVRCEAGLQALYHPDRLSAPLLRVGDRGAGQWEETSWTIAIATLAEQLQKANHSSGVVLATNPVGAQLGTVVEKFISTYGGRHIPFEPLERTVLRSAMKNVFQQDVMPDFDIENANYVLSFGADFLNTWVSPVRYARGYGRFRQGDRPRGTLIHVDSRFSMTGANADEWLYVNPGHEGLLALSMAQVIISERLGEASATNELTGGGTVDLSQYSPESVTERVGVDADRIRSVAIDFATHQPSIAIGGGSASAHTNGLSNLTAIYALNYLVGSVGKTGGIVFNPVPALTDVPLTPTTASFAEWKSLTEDMKQGQVEVLMVRGTDPLYGLTDGVKFRDALLGQNNGKFNVPLIVSFSDHIDDTTSMADIVLPEHNYLEDWGGDIPDPGPGYQTVGFQQPVVRPFLESRGSHLGTKGFADSLLAIARVMNMELDLPGNSYKDILENSARRLFNTGRGSVKAADFRSFWNGVLQRGGWWDTSSRYTGPSPKAPQLPDAWHKPDFDGPRDADTFYLIPFASTSLTDGRGAHLPWLQATPDPITSATWRTWIEINLAKAKEMGIREGQVIRINSHYGTIEALAYPHPGISPEVVSVPVGQGHTAGGRYETDRGANILSILAPTEDQSTGALAWAGTRVKIEKTDRWIRLPKMESTAPELSTDEGKHIIKLTPHDS